MKLVTEAVVQVDGRTRGNRHLSYVGISAEHRCDDASGDLALLLRYPDQCVSLTST